MGKDVTAIIEGFKSIKKEIKIPLGDLTILVGPPSSGKSNILEALALLGYGIKIAIEASLKEYGETGPNDKLSSFIRGVTCFDYLNRFSSNRHAVVSLGSSSVKLLCEEEPWLAKLVLSISNGENSRDIKEYVIDADLKPVYSLEQLDLLEGKSLDNILYLVYSLLLAQRERITEKPYKIIRTNSLSSVSGLEIIVPRLYGFDRLRAIDNIVRGKTGAFYPKSYLDEKARNIARLLYTRDDVLNKINQVLSELCDMTIKPLSDGRLAFFDHKREIGPSSVSDSVIRIIYGYSALYLSEKKVLDLDNRASISLRPLVMLEEPEAHMYPVAFSSLAEAVAEAISRKSLVLITTHSGRLAQILWEEVLRKGYGSRVYYVYRDPSEGTVLYEVDMRQLATRLEDLDYIVHEHPGDVEQMLRDKILQPLKTNT